MRSDPRYQSLDLWRGIACVAVAFHHAGFLLIVSETEGQPLRLAAFRFYQGLDLGVPIFFVISGYCIAASLDAHRRRGESAWHFLVRRFWRIYPPYWAAVAYFAAVVGTLDWFGWEPIRTGSHSLHLEPPGQLAASQWLGNLTLTETWRRWLVGGAWPLVLTRVGWTLGCEQCLYLVGFGLLLLARRWLFAALGIVFGTVLAAYYMLDDVGFVLWYSATLGRAWFQFAVGVAVYWRLVEARRTWSRRAVDLGLLALLIGSGCESAIFTGIVPGLILIALRPRDGRLAGLAALAPLRACGRRCYSIYLAHLPVVVVVAEATYQAGLTGFWARALVAAPLAALAGIAAGWPFYRLVESRFYRPSVAPADMGAAVLPAGALGPIVPVDRVAAHAAVQS